MENLYQDMNNLHPVAQGIYEDLGERYSPEAQRLYAKAMGMPVHEMDDNHVRTAIAHGLHAKGYTRKTYRKGRYGSPSRLREAQETCGGCNASSRNWKGDKYGQEDADETDYPYDDYAKHSEAAKKGWEERHERGDTGHEAAEKGWETRRMHEREQLRAEGYTPQQIEQEVGPKESQETGWRGDSEGHSRAAKKGWVTRRRRQQDADETLWPYDDYEKHSEAWQTRRADEAREGKLFWPQGHEQEHSQAAEKGWKTHRMHEREQLRQQGHSPQQIEQEVGGQSQSWRGDSEGHSAAARKGWVTRRRRQQQESDETIWPYDAYQKHSRAAEKGWVTHRADERKQLRQQEVGGNDTDTDEEADETVYEGSAPRGSQERREDMREKMRRRRGAQSDETLWPYDDFAKHSAASKKGWVTHRNDERKQLEQEGATPDEIEQEVGTRRSSGQRAKGYRSPAKFNYRVME